MVFEAVKDWYYRVCAYVGRPGKEALGTREAFELGLEWGRRFGELDALHDELHRNNVKIRRKLASLSDRV